MFLETNQELAQSDTLHSYSLQGDWTLEPETGNTLTQFNFKFDCSNPNVQGDLIYQFYQDGKNIIFITNKIVILKPTNARADISVSDWLTNRVVIMILFLLHCALTFQTFRLCNVFNFCRLIAV